MVKKRRQSPEICALASCFLIILLTVMQIFVFSQRNRITEHGRAFLGRNTMSEQVHPRANLQKEPPPLKHNSLASKSVQARVRARSKANQEVRELEKSLAKLMRENSITPEESIAILERELYARRITEIIHRAENGGVIPFNVNRSRFLTPPSQFWNANNTGRTEINQQENTRKDYSENQRLPYTNQTFGSLLNLHRARNSTKTSSMDIPNLYSRLKYPEQLDRSEDYELRYSITETVELPESNLSADYENSAKQFLEEKELYIDENVLLKQNGQLQNVCPAIPESLVGRITDVNVTISLDISDIINENSDVKDGGEWKPASCISRHRVAIIIPYRDRWSHLKVLLYYLIPILKRQQIHFRLFVVEQYGNDTFNKGRIMNAAFREALKLFDFQCVNFHDVDLLPEDDRNMYSCTEQPKHMSIGIDKFEYILPYENLVGGVLMFKTEHFELVNGYSNMYWGWGAEDDDMSARILYHKLRIYRPPSNIARYKMVKHDGRKSSDVTVRLKLLRSAARRSKLEGLNNVQYKLLSTHIERLFTHFIVDIGLP